MRAGNIVTVMTSGNGWGIPTLHYVQLLKLSVSLSVSESLELKNCVTHTCWLTLPECSLPGQMGDESRVVGNSSMR